ncbi:MAG: hypothetical protein V1837_06815 [Candidatus Woesearchaeota archaeon]
MTLEAKNQRIERLLQEKEALQKRIAVLEDWNSRWQTERWNQELAKQCAALVNECSNPQKKIIEYLSSVQGHKALRHVRGIARATGLNVAVVSIGLKELQKRKLVRAYINGSKKNYYTLPYKEEQKTPDHF